jgi:hypothetical protein
MEVTAPARLKRCESFRNVELEIVMGMLDDGTRRPAPSAGEATSR